MYITDLELDEAYSSMSKYSISIARMCLEELKHCRELESNCKMLATAPCARNTLRSFVNNVVGYPRMNIIFPAYFDELSDFLSEDNGIVTFLDFNAKVVTGRVTDLQNEPYPSPGIVINPHIGLTSSGYYARLSAVTSLITLYDKWIGLIEKFVSFYN